MGLTIDLARLGDVDGVERLYNEAVDRLVEAVNYPGWIKGVYPVRQTALDAAAEGGLYVARMDGEVVGSFVLRHKPEPAYAGAEWKIESNYNGIWVLYTFVVHPAFWGRGLGARMLHKIESMAAEKGIKALRLDVYEKNSPAIRLYRACGFGYIATVDLGLGDYGLHRFALYEKVL